MQFLQPDTSQAVADLQMMVEKAQRLAGCCRRNPERQFRQFHCQFIDISAKDAIFDDTSPPENRSAIKLVTPKGIIQSFNDKIRDRIGRVHEEMATAHSRITNPEAQDLLLDELQNFIVDEVL